MAASSSFGAIHSTLPFLRTPRPLLCRMMSSAWSQGTSFRRSVTVPVTVSLVTTLKLVKSAITCSSARTSMFWKFRLQLLALKPGPCVSLFGSTFTGRTSSTNWLSVW